MSSELHIAPGVARIADARDTDAPIAGWPIALPASGAAALFGLSERQWWRLHSAGRIPLPIRCGRSVRWRVDELRRWAEAGAPPRDAWQANEETPRARGAPDEM